MISNKDKSKRVEVFDERQIKFQAFGVKIGIEADEAIYLEEIYKILETLFPNGCEPVEEREIEYHFTIKSKNGEAAAVYRNGEKQVEKMEEKNFFNTIAREIRTTIAEFAVGRVFLHAGVVGWKDKAIIIPAQSFAGKSTLVAELVKKGATYYSDEYAVLDADGNVEPYPKWLSMRDTINSEIQTDCPVESFGAKAGTKTIPVGMVLIAKYKSGRKASQKWSPKRLTAGEGIMEILPHTFPLTNKPKFVLQVLNNLMSRAIIVKTIRGEAREFAETLLSYFESETI
ncbi:MAG: hypothetical protein ACR2HG_05970 [Pyrinomonadaceae bacterium]